MACYARGSTEPRSGIVQDLPLNGNVCFPCNERALSLSSKAFKGPDIFKACALIFAQDNFHPEALMQRTRCSGDKVKAIGETRLDLLGPTFRSFHNQEVGEMKAQICKSILFNTNASIVHSAWGSLEDHEQLLISIGRLDKN